MGALSFVAATLATGDVSLTGRHGDWHAATEGLYKPASPTSWAPPGERSFTSTGSTDARASSS